MNRMFAEDLNQEKIQWVIENIDELFLDMEEDENDTVLTSQLSRCSTLSSEWGRLSEVARFPHLSLQFFYEVLQ